MSVSHALAMLSLILLLTFCAHPKETETRQQVSFTTIEEGFQHPPDSVKPSMYWYWLSDNVSAAGVAEDVKAMAKIGVGRAFVGNIGLNASETAYGDVRLFSPEWWAATRQALKSAAEDSIVIGLFNSPGWSQSGGPWVKPQEAMRYLAYSETNIKGPQRLSQQLKQPAPDFQDVAVLAFPADEGKAIAQNHPAVTANQPVTDIKNMVDGNLGTESTFIDSTLTIDVQVASPFTARSLLLYPAHVPFKASVRFQVKEKGKYQTIREFELDRSNPQLNVGFKPYSPVAIAFPAVQAQQFRLVFSAISGAAGLAEIVLSPTPYLERFEEKQLAKMFQTPLPLWNEYQWQTQPEATDTSLAINAAQVINITDKLLEDGTLEWEVPQGQWTVLRLGMTPTGVTNAPAAPEGQGLEVDKLSKDAVKHHFDAFIGQVLDSIPEKERTAWQWVVADSYETGSQNWTDGFAKDFRQQYGYDPLPWLPVLSGRVVESAEKSDRFLWDMRRLVADRVAYQYVAGLRELSHEHDMKLWLENYGHWGFPGEFLQYGGQSDEVAGEFWNEGELGSIELRAAASAAHIYGKNKVAAESFTAAGQAYARYPALLKKRGDWSFTEGVNHTLLHVYVHQPYDDRNPGVNAGFGTEFNRKNTWFDQADMFVDYLRRCMWLLQQGKPVADVAYFIGEDVPKMTGVRNPELPEGYNFDYINAEVIENRLSVEDGRLVLPDGISYRMLVLPRLETMRPELLQKIKELVSQGAVILGPAPSRSPSLQNYPKADEEVKQMSAELWGDRDMNKPVTTHFGKGMVITGTDMQAALNQLDIVPDVKISKNQPMLYTHRRLPVGDLYFVSNQSDQPLNIAPAFRIAGKQPEFWDAVTGNIRDLPDFTAEQQSTVVPLKLAPYQSGFVVFRKAASASGKQADNFSEPTTIATLAGPWTVSFNQKMRGPAAPVTFAQLTDWTQHSNEHIKYYSGKATYLTTFQSPQVPEGSELYLDLGRVGVMARVKINGQPVGGVWTAPWRVNITDVIKGGENKLEIEVVNTWVNRLIGDSKLPPEQRKTWTNVNPYTSESALQPSGLVGPVTLQQIGQE